MVNILRMYYILVPCTTIRRKKALHVSFSLLFGNSFHVILHSHQKGLRIDYIYPCYMYYLVLIPLKIFTVFLTNFEKMMLKKIESICSFFFFYSFFFFIENCFFINIILKNMRVIRG